MATKLTGEARRATLAGLKGWAEVQGRDAIRLSVSSWATTDADVERTLNAIEAAMAPVGADTIRA